MNSIVAASLFDNPWVFVVIAFVGVISNWLVKRRQAGALGSPGESDSPPPRGQQERSARQPDLQDVLRQLLGGEPPPAATPPPVPRISRDEQALPAEGDEEPFRPMRRWPDESPESYEGLPQPLNQVAEHSRRHTIAASVVATPVEGGDRHENAVLHVVPLDTPPKHPVRAMRAAPRRHSRVDAGAVRLWRTPRIVRRAFVASLIFAPPKGLEA